MGFVGHANPEETKRLTSQFLTESPENLKTCIRQQDVAVPQKRLFQRQDAKNAEVRRRKHGSAKRNSAKRNLPDSQDKCGLRLVCACTYHNLTDCVTSGKFV